MEVRSAMHGYIYGLGGRDFDLKTVAIVIEDLQKSAAGEKMQDVTLLGLRP